MRPEGGDEMGTKGREVPNGWEVVKLKDVCAYALNGGTPSTKIEEYWVGDIPWITGADIVDQKVGTIRRFITNDAVQNSSTHVVPRDNLLIVTRTGIGKLAIAPFDVAISQDITGFIPKDIIDVCYLFWALNKSQGHFKIFDQGTSINGITRGDLMAFRVPLPTLFEQRKIAAILSSVDSAIGETDAIITQTEQVKQGLMQELLTKGIGHTKFKDTKVGSIPPEWEVVRLGKVCNEMTIGVVNSATTSYTEKANGIPYFLSQNVHENKLTQPKIYVTKDFCDKHSQSIFKIDDVITLQTGFVGTSCIVPKKYVGANCHSLLITRPNSGKLLSKFLCHLLNSPYGKSLIKHIIVGGGRDHILLTDFRKLLIPLPSLEEQQRISLLISNIYNKIEYELEHRAQLEMVKKGLMQDLLTGKKRVKVDGHE